MQSIDTFVKIENKYNLYDKEIEGVNYWIYCRTSIFKLLMAQKYNLGVAHRFNTAKLTDKIRIGAKLVYYSYIKRYKIPHKTDVLIYNHPRRVVGEDGYYECCYTTDIGEHYENVCILESPDTYEHKVPIREKNIIYMDRAKVMSNLYYIYVKCFQKKRYGMLKEKVRSDIYAPLHDIAVAEQIELDENHIIKLLVKRVLVCKKKKKYYEKLLKKIQPKVIVEVVSYGKDSMILNELGKQYGIPTVELQHGTMGDTHIAYNYGNARNIKQFPEYEFLFSDYWKETTPFPILPDRVKVVGYPRFEHYLKSHQKPETDKRGICFISAGTIGKELSCLALELSKQLDMNKWRIFYKLHPGEFANWRNYYPWLEETDIEVVGEGGMGLYDVFLQCSVQVGVSSTALFEGLGFHLHTLIFKRYGSEIFEDLCQKGYATYIENVQDCVNELENNNRQYTLSFWKENAAENMIRELDEILKMQ